MSKQAIWVCPNCRTCSFLKTGQGVKFEVPENVCDEHSYYRWGDECERNAVLCWTNSLRFNGHCRLVESASTVTGGPLRFGAAHRQLCSVPD